MTRYDLERASRWDRLAVDHLPVCPRCGEYVLVEVCPACGCGIYRKASKPKTLRRIGAGFMVGL